MDHWYESWGNAELAERREAAAFDHHFPQSSSPGVRKLGQHSQEPEGGPCHVAAPLCLRGLTCSSHSWAPQESFGAN